MIRVLLALTCALLTACTATIAPKEQNAQYQYRTVPPEETERVEKEMCEKVGCVFDARIVLRKKNGSIFDKTYRSLPVVQPNGVSVYAGQTVLFEADVEKDQLTNFRLVASTANPAKTISVKLEQESDGRMILITRNPFEKHLKISMGVMVLDRDNFLKTSSCPVIARGSSYEEWPYPIFQVWLTDMHFVEIGNSVTCSE